jgi:hypothetical protein
MSAWTARSVNFVQRDFGWSILYLPRDTASRPRVSQAPNQPRSLSPPLRCLKEQALFAYPGATTALAHCRLGRTAQLICLSSPICKNISILHAAKSLHKRRRLAPVEGRIAIVTDVGSEMRWTRRRARTKRAVRGRPSRVVLTPRRRRQIGNDACASLVAMLRIAPMTVTRKPDRRGEHEVSR